VPLVYANECRYESCAGTQIGLPLAAGAIGAAIGWGIDRAIRGWTTVYQAKRAAPRVAVEMRPGAFTLNAAVGW
jgi:hypothetical protein